MKSFKGLFTALITPFDDQGKIDFGSLEKIVNHQLEGGVDGFVINGTTAESPTLIENEKSEIFKFVKKIVNERIPLIMGTGTNCTQTTIQYTQEAQRLGADAALVVVPYYNKPPQKGLFKHFEVTAKSVDMPIILYNVPGRTITSLEVETICELSQIPNIIGIKEASGNLSFDSKIKTSCSAEFIMLSGDDSSYVDFLKLGGHGAISVTSHVFPKQMVNWKRWCAEGNFAKAESDFLNFKNIFELFFCEGNPIPLKYILHKMKIIDYNQLRLPLVSLNESWISKIEAEMQKANLI